MALAQKQVFGGSVYDNLAALDTHVNRSSHWLEVTVCSATSPKHAIYSFLSLITTPLNLFLLIFVVFTTSVLFLNI